jgi:fumarate hydratase subunit beta
MDGPIKLQTPFSSEEAEKLKAGDQVLLSGQIYTGRDAAHRRLVELIEQGKELPIPLKDQIIYYVGPAPAKPGRPIGSAGPTTSYRMDAYAPRLISLGLRGMIGKGGRAPEVIEAMKKYKAVYFAAVGGAGALISERISDAKIIAYEDLGPEAIRQLTIVEFPVVVINDTTGRDLYQEGVAAYRKSS